MKKMNVSDISILNGIRIETKTDAHQLIADETSLKLFIIEHGDVEVKFDKEWRVYRVPSFRAAIKLYTARKVADCAIWGCN